MVRAFRRLGHEAWPYGTVYQTGQMIACPPPWTPDLILYIECGDSDPQYLHFANRGRVPLVYWEFDTARYPERTRTILDALKPEHVYLANPDMVPAFPGAEYLPYAADDQKFKPWDGPKHGAAIIGSPFPERVDFARKIGVDVIQTRTGQEYADAVAKLQVHVHHTNSGGEGLLVMRYWETLACGTVLLCPDSPSVRCHFTPGITLKCYRTPLEAKDMLERQLASNEVCQRFANMGRAQILAHHTYRHRAQAILDGL